MGLQIAKDMQCTVCELETAPIIWLVAYHILVPVMGAPNAVGISRYCVIGKAGG